MDEPNRPASSPQGQNGRSSDAGTRTFETTVITVALLGIAFFFAYVGGNRNRTFHEGIWGLIVAVGCSCLLVRRRSQTWQERVAKLILVLAVLSVLAAIALFIILLSSMHNYRF